MATPNVVFALSVLNLLLCVGGLLFVYFDWNAAKRREYLYLYFTEEKPTYDYFSAARRKRAQYTRLMAAFGVLSLRQFLSVILSASVSQPSDWSAWLEWWRSGKVVDTITLAANLQPWLGVLEAIGLALLAFALLHEWKNKEDNDSIVPVILLGSVVTISVLLAVGYSINVFGAASHALMLWATLISRLALLAFLIAVLRKRSEQPEIPGLLVFPASTLSLALGAWLVLPSLGDILKWPALYPLGLFIAFFLLVGSIARVTLNEYEGMELSRHRLGRERNIIFSFLKKLGAAFTTDVEVGQVLDIILNSALDTTDANAGAIYLIDSKSGLLEPRIVLNFFPPMYVEVGHVVSPNRTEELVAQMRLQKFEMGEGIIGEVAQSGHAQIIADVKAAGIMRGTTTEYMRNRSMLVVPLKVRDEILGVMVVLNKQRGSFGGEDESLLQTLADQASLSVNNAMLTVEVAEQERLKRDLQIARDIQQRLLPKSCPQIPGFEIAARGTSALEVGGDYYDFFWVDDDHLGIVVADVSGKGVYAALIVAMIRSAFRTQAPGNLDVCDVLSRVNSFISGDLRRDMFVTCVYGILEIPTKKFSWARAGHEPIIVAHENEPVDIISPDGFALGLIGAPDFRDLLELNTIELHSGDKLLMFTDGLTEAMNTKGEEFGMDRILESLAHPSTTADGHGKIFDNGAGCQPRKGDDEPDEMKTLEEAVQNHVGDAPQSDDLTFVFLSTK